MANTNAPFGLKPYQNIGQTTFITNPYYIDSTSISTSLYPGDPVIITGNANDDIFNNGQLIIAGSMPTITRATAGSSNNISAIIGSFNPLPSALWGTGSTYYTQGTGDRIAYCYDKLNPDQLFYIQDDGVVTLTTSAVGQNANIIFGSTSSSSNPISAAMLNTSSVDTSNALQLNIRGVYPSPTNTVGSPYCIWLVAINLASSTVPATGI